MEERILQYIKSKIHQKSNCKPCVIVSGDKFINNILTEGFQFNLSINVTKSKLIKLNFTEISFTKASYVLQPSGIATLMLLHMISFFNDSQFKLTSTSNNGFVVETEMPFEAYDLMVDLLSFISNNQLQKMSLHKDLHVYPEIIVDELEFHANLQSILNDVNLFNSNIFITRCLLSCKTNNKFFSLPAKIGVYNLSNETLILSLTLDCDYTILDKIEYELNRLGFNANRSVYGQFIQEIIIFYEPKSGINLEHLLDQVIKTVL